MRQKLRRKIMAEEYKLRLSLEAFIVLESMLLCVNYRRSRSKDAAYLMGEAITESRDSYAWQNWSD
jgi:hypothetical protein